MRFTDIPFIPDDLRRMFNTVGNAVQSNRLVKYNVWYDRYPHKMQLKPINVEQFKENIELVPYIDHNKPVVYDRRVYQLVFRDWDNDMVLKDDFNGVKIIPTPLNGYSDRMEAMAYEEQLCSYAPEHPLNKILQIKHYDVILEGNTQELQSIVDLYYWKKAYI